MNQLISFSALRAFTTRKTLLTSCALMADRAKRRIDIFSSLLRSALRRIDWAALNFAFSSDYPLSH